MALGHAQPLAQLLHAVKARVVCADVLNGGLHQLSLIHIFPREDIYIDCLTLTASAQQKDVLATVQALEACKKELGVRTILRCV